MGKKKKGPEKPPKTNKIVSCQHRKWVDEQLIEYEKGNGSYRKISEGLLKLDPPVVASYEVVRKYHKWFFNIEEKKQEILDDESNDALTNEALDQLRDMKDLQEVANKAFGIGQTIKTDFEIKPGCGFTELDVEKHKNQVWKTGIQAQNAINRATENLKPSKHLKYFGELELLKDPDWITSKKEAMDRLYARKRGSDG